MPECVCGCAVDRCTCEAALTSARVHPSRLALSPASSQSMALSPAPRPPSRHFLSRLADSEALLWIVWLRWVDRQAVDWLFEWRRRPRKERIIGVVCLALFRRTEGEERTRGRPAPYVVLHLRVLQMFSDCAPCQKDYHFQTSLPLRTRPSALLESE